MRRHAADEMIAGAGVALAAIDDRSHEHQDGFIVLDRVGTLLGGIVGEQQHRGGRLRCSVFIVCLQYWCGSTVESLAAARITPPAPI